MAWTTNEYGEDEWIDDASDPVYDDQSGGDPIPEVTPDPVYNDAKFNIPNNVGQSSPTGSTGAFTDIAKSFGLIKADGSWDMSKLMGLAAGAATLVQGANAQYTPKSPGQLLAMQPSNTPKWDAAQVSAMQRPMQAGTQLARQPAASMPSPIVPGQKYADGGEVEGPLTASAPFVGYVDDPSGGQADLIDAKLSGGEYVFDAESVAMIGDGNNAAGAQKLDELRAALREHKRSAPMDEIAPPAEGPLSYMGATNG